MSTVKQLLELSPSEFYAQAQSLITLGEPFLVVGDVGIGKTTLSIRAAQTVGCQHVLVEMPSLRDPSDYTGIPMVIKNKAELVPLGALRFLFETKERVHVLFDELDKANRQVQNAVAQIILQREVAGMKISPLVTFSASANRLENRAGSHPMPSHLVDRLVILPMQTSLNDWCQEAVRENLPTSLIAFVRFKPEYLLKGQDVQKAMALEKTPTPRSISKVGRLIQAGIKEVKVLSGVVGRAFASEYLAFDRMFNTIVSIDQILMAPTTAPIPQELDQLYAVSIAVGARLNRTNFPAAIAYLERLEKPFHFAAVKLGLDKDPSLYQTQEFINWSIKYPDLVT